MDRSHLDTRMRTLKLGVMKTTLARRVWDVWRHNRDAVFVDWFEKEIYDGNFHVPKLSERGEETMNQTNIRR